MEFDASLFVIMAIFWIAYWVLRVSFFRPMLGILEAREATVRSAQAAYDEATERMAEALGRERERLADARREAQARRDEVRRQAEEQRDSLLAGTRATTQAELAEAGQELDRQLVVQRELLETEARGLAARMTERLLQRVAS